MWICGCDNTLCISDRTARNFESNWFKIKSARYSQQAQHTAKQN